mmetsp:Transcript_82253/g.232786  ORF Transcript_82253/g.232786 Transcript_82253/m.232786 type:complete len:322 (+) Transcript_82253:1019-1984(+)
MVREQREAAGRAAQHRAGPGCSQQLAGTPPPLQPGEYQGRVRAFRHQLPGTHRRCLWRLPPPISERALAAQPHVAARSARRTRRPGHRRQQRHRQSSGPCARRRGRHRRDRGAQRTKAPGGLRVSARRLYPDALRRHVAQGSARDGWQGRGTAGADRHRGELCWRDVLHADEELALRRVGADHRGELQGRRERLRRRPASDAEGRLRTLCEHQLRCRQDALPGTDCLQRQQGVRQHLQQGSARRVRWQRGPRDRYPAWGYGDKLDNAEFRSGGCRQGRRQDRRCRLRWSLARVLPGSRGCRCKRAVCCHRPRARGRARDGD